MNHDHDDDSTMIPPRHARKRAHKTSQQDKDHPDQWRVSCADIKSKIEYVQQQVTDSPGSLFTKDDVDNLLKGLTEELTVDQGEGIHSYPNVLEIEETVDILQDAIDGWDYGLDINSERMVEINEPSFEKLLRSFRSKLEEESGC